MAAAVVVTSPAGPPTPECPIYLQANEAIVTWTQQFIDWQAAPADAAGAARVSIGTFQAIKAFAPRCLISRNGPDMLAAHAINMLGMWRGRSSARNVRESVPVHAERHSQRR